MANNWQANTIHIDSTGAIAGIPRNIKVTGFFFTPSAAKDSITLYETSAGPTKMIISGGVAGQTDFHKLGESYVVFSNGIYVHAITSGATACLITSTAGSTT